MASPTHAKVKSEICRFAMIIAHCENVLKIELREVDTATWDMPLQGNRCVDRREEINEEADEADFTPGQRNRLMMVRACAVFDPMFPAAGLGAQLPRDASGGYRLIATSGFVNEP
jgi:hypothetical protein